MKRIIIIILFVSFLGGCSFKSQQELMTESLERERLVLSNDKRICESHGLKFETPEFSNCLMTLRKERIQDQQAVKKGRANRWNAFNNTIQNLEPVYPSRPARGYECTSRPGLGTGALASVTTTCN